MYAAKQYQRQKRTNQRGYTKGANMKIKKILATIYGKISLSSITRIGSGSLDLRMCQAKHNGDQTEEHIYHNHDNVLNVEAAKRKDNMAHQIS